MGKRGSRVFSEGASALSADGLKRNIVELAQGFSTEVLPREASPENAALRQALLPPGTCVYLTFLANSSFAEMASAAAELRREGFEPVPHIAARSLRDAGELDDCLRRLSREANVAQALVIAGDCDLPRGDFHSTMQLLETGLFEKHGIRRIGVAGHPEGHPAASAEILWDALAAKAAFAARTGCTLYVVTQFCFEPEPLIEFERALRRKGLAIPIHAGLPGAATIRSLLAYAKSCGIGPSVRALTRRGGSLARLTAVRTPDRIVTALARYRAEEPACRIERLHLFPLGAFARTAEWMGALRAGRFAVSADGRGFSIERAEAG